MKLQERSYSTKIIRPRPFIHQEEDGSLVVIATSWGQPEHGQRVLDEIVKYINAAKSDVEVTSPFEFLTCLTDEVNYLRISILIANDLLYRSENKREYFSGVEVLALLKRGQQLSWAQVGSPSLLIKRKGESLQPLSVGLDIASELQGGGTPLPPLPAQLLGLDPTCNIQCGHTRIGEEDQCVLYAGSSIAPGLWNSDGSLLDLSTVTNKLIQENPESPFWLGLIQSS